MMCLEQTGANRALAVACWLGTAVIVPSWRLSLAGVTTTVRRLRAAGTRVRVASVSQAWLREYDAECVKHDDAR
jgi:chorismate-pyruvate lyase